MISSLALDMRVMGRGLFFLTLLIFTGYFSTMAILYLVYSGHWKRVGYSTFLTFSHTVAILVSMVAFVSRSNIILSMIQVALLAIALLSVFVCKKKGDKKVSLMKLGYIFVFVFWILNLFLMNQRSFFVDLRLFFQALSLAAFGFIFYKISKWTR